MKVRVFYRADGGVSILTLIEKGRRPGETDEQMFDRISRKIPALFGLPFEDKERHELPTRDQDRNNWTHSMKDGRRIIYTKKDRTNA